MISAENECNSKTKQKHTYQAKKFVSLEKTSFVIWFIFSFVKEKNPTYFLMWVKIAAQPPLHVS